MKRCRHIQAQLPDFAAGLLPEEARKTVQRHLDTCETCRLQQQRYQNGADLLARASLSGEEPPASFDRQLHLRLSLAAASQRTASAEDIRGWFRKPAVAALTVAMAFVIGIAVGGVLMQGTNGANGNADSMVRITKAEVETGKPVTVRLVFTSDEEIRNVAFDIELEPGVEFATSDSEIAAMQVLQWNGDLKRGRNEIPFAVTVAKPGRWVVTARAQYHDETHEHRIVLLTEKDR